MNYSRPNLWSVPYPFAAEPPWPNVANQPVALRWGYALRDANVRVVASVTRGADSWSVNDNYGFASIPQGAGIANSSVEQSLFHSQTASGSSSGGGWPVGFPFARADGAARALFSTRDIVSYTVVKDNLPTGPAGAATYVKMVAADSPVHFNVRFEMFFDNGSTWLTTESIVGPTLLATYALQLGASSTPLYLYSNLPAGLSWSFTQASITPDFFA